MMKDSSQNSADDAALCHYSWGDEGVQTGHGEDSD